MHLLQQRCFSDSIPSVLDQTVEQGFVFTYKKLQGATLDRFILVLNDLTKCKLGDMSIHKLYVALSRVRNGRYLAIFNMNDEDLEYLVKQRYPDRLLAWYGNYDRSGMWKTNVTLVFEDIDRLFEEIKIKKGSNL